MDYKSLRFIIEVYTFLPKRKPNKKTNNLTCSCIPFLYRFRINLIKNVLYLGNKMRINKPKGDQNKENDKNIQLH